MDIVWTRSAGESLNAIFDFILADNPGAALDVCDRIERSVRPLAEFPGSGRPGRVPDTRELILADLPDIIVYSHDDNEVTILAIRHAAREWPDTF